jgi:hypothetical protein
VRIMNDERYILWYETFENDFLVIEKAISKDGITWVKSRMNVISPKRFRLIRLAK